MSSASTTNKGRRTKRVNCICLAMVGAFASCVVANVLLNFLLLERLAGHPDFSISSYRSALALGHVHQPTPVHTTRNSHCAQLFADFDSGALIDPSKNATDLAAKSTEEKADATIQYKRLTITEPPFWISLHSPAVDNVRWSIMTHGRYYEFSLTNYAREIFLTNKGSTSTGRGILVDVGMNIGWYSLWARALGVKLVGFEPNPANRLRFCESLRLNGWSDEGNGIQISGDAIGDHGGNFSLISDTTFNPGGALLVPETAKVKDSQVLLADRITRIKLDDFARAEGWFESGAPPIALLKIDVEGQDSQVIFGARELLQSGHVLNMFLEYSCGHISKEKTMKEISSILESANYTIQNIGKWDGSPYKGAMEEVLGGNDGSLSSRLWNYCRKLNQGKNHAHLNLWWTLQL